MENAEMVALDALTDAPTLYAVLTTVDPHVTRETVMRDLEQTTKAMRRRWPEFQYACFVEFTTGLSPRSGGHRRIHLNLLVKGVPVDAAAAAENVMRGSWGRRTKTSQLYVGPIYAADGLVRYVTNLALHVMKDGQKPPPTYAGHLIRSSRGYFAESATVQREAARDSLRVKRELWKLLRECPEMDAATLDDVLTDRLAYAAERTYRFVHLPLKALAPPPRPPDDPEAVQWSLARLERRGTSALRVLLDRVSAPARGVTESAPRGAAGVTPTARMGAGGTPVAPGSMR